MTRFFNRLWVRFSLVFVVVVLLAFGSVLLLAGNLVSEQRVESVLDRQIHSANGLLQLMTSYYEEQGSWAGVEQLMAGARAMLLTGTDRRLILVLLDGEGQLIYPSIGPPMMHGRPIRSSSLSLLTPITVDSAIVGYLAFAPSGMMRGSEMPASMMNPPSQNGAPDLLQELSVFLMRAAALGGILALIFGVVMSRGLTAPLNKLAEAAQAIGAGKLGHRVSLAGGEEMRTVAHSFNEMAAQLEQAEILRRNMLADVAHELRTPLTVLQGNLQAMLDGVYPMAQDEVARLYEQTRHLHRLVDDLHLLAQAEARQLPLHPQPVDVNRLLHEAADLFAPLAEEQGIRLAVAGGDALPAIEADRARLGQVFHNLVSNALRHTPAGGQVTLSARAEGDRVHIEVADSGEGIAAEHLAQVFERFYRTDKARNRDSGGTGLGLAIVQAIIHAHGGQVWAESPGPGQGTTIHVVIGVLGDWGLDTRT